MDGNEVAKIDLLETVDTIVEKCLPIQANKTQKFSEVFQLAEGIKTLRVVFDREEIKSTVNAMRDTRLGFLTDRSEKALAIARKNKKNLSPYHYNVLREACIEAMLSGYRLTGNEFNVIAGNFYATKNGKLRRINECPGVSDFEFTTTTPKYETDKLAMVQCFASWKMNGKVVKLGYSEDGKEDKLIIKIRVNKMMGEDAVVGKALSKLFSRVLIRLEGRISAASDEPDEGAINVTPEVTDDDMNALLQKKPHQMDSNESLVAGLLRRNPRALPQMIEDDRRYINTLKKERPELYQMLVTHWNISFPDETFPLEPKRESLEGPPADYSGITKKDGLSQYATDEADPWLEFRKSWIYIRAESTFLEVINEYKTTFEECREQNPELYAEAVEKWEKVSVRPWPLEKQDEKEAERDRLRKLAGEVGDRDEAGQDEDQTEPSMDFAQEKAQNDLRAWRKSAPTAFDNAMVANGYSPKDKIGSIMIDECERLIEAVASEFGRLSR